MLTKFALAPLVLLTTTAVLLPAVPAMADKGAEISLSEVPKVVVDAARSRLQGITLTEAEKIDRKGVILYELEGLVGDQEHELLISPSGEVLSVELDD